MWYNPYLPNEQGYTAYMDGAMSPELASYYEGDPNYRPGDAPSAGMQPYNSGAPSYPGYQPIYSGDNPLRFGGESMSVAGINPDPRGMDAFRESALRTGASPWADLATAKSYTDQAAAEDSMRSRLAGGQATARGDLAMHGGLRGGARERLAASGGRNLALASTDLAKQGIANRSQIGINDEQNRITQLGMLPGMDMNLAEFNLKKKNTDVTHQMEESKNRNDFNMDLYNAGMTNWAAGKQANAISNSGGSWLCTEALARASKSKEWHYKDAAALKKFRSYALRKYAHAARFYVYECKDLIERMHEAGSVDWKEQLRFVRRIISLAEGNALEKCMREYTTHIRDLIEKYWPECEHPAYLVNKRKGAA